MNDQEVRKEIQYEREHHYMETQLNIYKFQELLKQISIEYAHRIKKTDCMFTRDCFQVYLQAMADTIANSEQQFASLLPIIQEIKNQVFGG